MRLRSKSLNTGAALLLLPAALWAAGCCGTCPSARKAAKKADADCPTGACAPGAAMTAPAETEKAAAGYSEINTDALAMLLKSGADVVVLDARSGKWDDGRRIPGAKALAADTTEEQALEVIGGKDKLIVTYCTNLKCPASKHLSKRLIELGFENVMKYPEGIDEWQQRGHPVNQIK